MDLTATTQAVVNIVTSGAIVIGGIWAYFKFIRGRAFAHRAELNVSASFEGGPGSLYIYATVTLKNTGLSKLPLNSNMKAIRLFGIATETEERLGLAKWERILTRPVLEQHMWLEAQETVTDAVVFRLGSAEGRYSRRTAYQMEAIVGARRRFITRKGTKWQSRAVVFLSSNNSPNDSPSNPPALAGPPRKGSLMRKIATLRKELRNE